MSDKNKTSKTRIKFSPLEMEDRFIDGNHEEFDYKSQFQLSEDTINAKQDAISTITSSSTTTAINSDKATDTITGSVDSHAHGLGGDLKSAVLGIVKGMVGPAILYLPHGFAQAGWIVAIPMLFASTALYLASSASLLECWKVETANRKRMSVLEMKELKEVCWKVETANRKRMSVLEMKELKEVNSHNIVEEFDNEFINGAVVVDKSSSNTATATIIPTTPSYPDLAYRAYGSRGETLVKIGIAAMQSGVCLTYLIFVPQNMRSSCRALFKVDLPPSVFLLAMVLVQIPLSWIQDIRHLTVTNALANGLIMYGLITCLVFAFGNAIVPTVEQESDEAEGGDDSNRGPFAEIIYKFLNLTPLLEQASFYSEGSITLLIPLQEAVATPQDRQHFSKMYPNVILCIIWFYMFFGIFCWMSFGDDVHTVMTTSLPEGNALATTVQMAYSVAVMLTFPLQNYPSLEITCTAIAAVLQKVSTTVTVRVQIRILQILQRRKVLSSLMVCLLALIAILTMDRLDKVVSLMGGLLGCPLAFVFPPLIHNKLASATPASGFSEDLYSTNNNYGNGVGGYNLSDRRRLQNKIVASLGFGAMIVATVA
eukprot:CAMPEP_0170825714 /NCGR_PEP_ID=MMETSP0733-20121128/46107_1 /TAXON_ID=186038 /ORGANISM="Fragilariopsis kerguelensis, Strain L26-C5" /LENGTH=596 /DNA_ID=CAMNT_0011189293 /DNA_START=52 /DNA_END=1838 /DNA_ORIENTATION=+